MGNTGRSVQKFLKKEADIDKILKIIQWKVLKGTHLSITIKDLKVGYLISSYFKDIYLCNMNISLYYIYKQNEKPNTDIHLYLAQNNLPRTTSAIRKVEALAEKYILLDLLMFKVISTPDKETAI